MIFFGLWRLFTYICSNMASNSYTAIYISGLFMELFFNTRIEKN